MLCLKARAKINWTLDILGTRPDGYHLMDMLMQSVALHDTLWLDHSGVLSLEPKDEGANSFNESGDHLSSATVTFDQNNLVFKAANKLLDYTGVKKGARMILRKQIPSGAGMGGGSADAAAALVGLNRLWNLGLAENELQKIGLTVGADVPFMIGGGLARVSGIGEVITPLPRANTIWLLLIQPCDGLSTKEIFTGFDAMPQNQIIRPDNAAAQAALAQNDLDALGQAMSNVLEPTSLQYRDEMKLAIDKLKEAGAIRAMMTGSGSVVYGVFSSYQHAQSAQEYMRYDYPACKMTETVHSGVVFDES
ncbi:MAG: 4-(cytidine 5'-diphospho)-2-C-methyl-D-erythritol kinase [Clostridiales bacterium]|nr:4-(cytidine 5'-diphospho)-2-C-methyl-D-erythritol kinase [Clostridiales bacterium]